ncbi:MAG: hypothetical protein WCX31_08785 [Salinivirgaceae bacterium]|jgi:hypothetical protein
MDPKKIMTWFSVLFLITYIPYSQLKFPYMRWRIDQNLKYDTALVQGILVSHNWYDSQRHWAISIVEFKANGKKYYAKTDRLKVTTGISLMVKYKIKDPTWNRVMVPDSLLPFQCSKANFLEEMFYTWPPTTNKMVILRNNAPNGPF